MQKTMVVRKAVPVLVQVKVPHLKLLLLLPHVPVLHHQQQEQKVEMLLVVVVAAALPKRWLLLWQPMLQLQQQRPRQQLPQQLQQV